MSIEFNSHQVKCPGPEARSADAPTVDAVVIVTLETSYSTARCPMLERDPRGGQICKLSPQKLSCVWTGWNSWRSHNV